MRILHVIPSYLPAKIASGPIKPTHALNKELVKKGIEVVVYTTNLDGKEILDVSLNKEINIDGVKVYYFPITWRFWHYSFSLHRALAENAKNFDLIHITSVFLSASTLGAYYAKKFNKPYIISPHGSLMREPLSRNVLKKKIYIKLIENKNLIGAEAIHFTVEKEKDDYLKLGLPLEKAIIISNSIDLGNAVDAVFSNNFREKFKISKEKKIVIFIGRLHQIKGLDTLILAFAKVVKKEPEIVLVLAGPDDGCGKNLKSQISNLKINDKVIFTGMLLGGDKIAAYCESDVFVLPSYSENFGMAVIEAMYCELPVVITKGVGIANEVEKNGAGLVVEKEVGQVAEAILKILQNPEISKKMGENGRKLVETEFSSEKVAKKWIEEYNKLL